MASAPGVRTDHLVWTRTFVDGRPALYGAAGEGLPVVFLHGWALGSHTYNPVFGTTLNPVAPPAFARRREEGIPVPDHLAASVRRIAEAAGAPFLLEETA